jgi:hypothetical protein
MQPGTKMSLAFLIGPKPKALLQPGWGSIAEDDSRQA